jgi:hypothetical protein
VSDGAELYRKLRLETISLLNLDAANLTVAQSTKVDLVASLRLALDGLTAKQLAGESIDLGKLLSASEALERLLPKAVFDAEPNRPSHEDDVRKRFSDLIDRYTEHHEHERDIEIRELNAALAEKDQVIAEKNSVIAALGGAAAQAAASPAPTPSAPRKQTSSQPSQPPPSSAPPAHYLRGPDEPWRGYEGGRSFDRWSNRG